MKAPTVGTKYTDKETGRTFVFEKVGEKRHDGEVMARGTWHFFDDFKKEDSTAKGAVRLSLLQSGERFTTV